MARKCDICGGKIGLKAFRCQDGHLCGKCYEIVSHSFTTTITNSTLAELRKTYNAHRSPLEHEEDGFQVTKKVGSYLVMDEIRKKFFIPSNQAITGVYTQPEVFSYRDIQGYKLVSIPSCSPEVLADLNDRKRPGIVLQRLSIHIRIKNTKKELVLIPTRVRTVSFAFRRSYKRAMELCECLSSMMDDEITS